jgi:hypothetical protein
MPYIYLPFWLGEPSLSTYSASANAGPAAIRPGAARPTMRMGIS